MLRREKGERPAYRKCPLRPLEKINYCAKFLLRRLEPRIMRNVSQRENNRRDPQYQRLTQLCPWFRHLGWVPTATLYPSGPFLGFGPQPFKTLNCPIPESS